MCLIFQWENQKEDFFPIDKMMRKVSVAVEVRNVMEIFVEMNLDKAIDGVSGTCHCEQCRADIKALTLNKLRPMYVSSLKGEVMSKLLAFDTGKQVEFLCCVHEAVDTVRECPHHSA